MNKFLTFILCILLFQKNLFASEPAKTFLFEENKGQWDQHIQFKVALSGVDVFFERDGFTYDFLNKDELQKLGHRQYSADESPILHRHCLKMKFLEADIKQTVKGENSSESNSNYYIGQDEATWKTGVKSFEKISYPDLYPGITAHVAFTGNYLKYDFLIAPGAHPEKIKMEYSGADKVYIEDGYLYLKTSLGQIAEMTPLAWQEINGQKKNVKTEFVLEGNSASFQIVDSYDHSLPLIIDPTLVVSTYTGSAANNWGFTGTYDSLGNIYTGGVALGTGYPVTTGAYQQTFAGGGSGGSGNPFDIVVTKLNPLGTALLYSTYLGGSDNELPNSLVVNSHLELIIFGTTYSSNFPVTVGASDVSYNGGGDMIVSKLSQDGTALLASTFIGGSGEDGVNTTSNELDEFSLKQNYGDDARGEVMVDSSGSVYIASSTMSPNFPVTAGAFQTTFGGGNQDGCVIKLDSSLAAITFATFLGGSDEDAAYSLDLDPSHNVYVTGGTISPDFPTTSGALHTSFSGGLSDGYVTKISASGANVLNSTFIGTNFYDQSYFVKLDHNNDVYLYGQTSGAYPVTPGVYSNPNSSQFIHKLNNSLSTTIFSTVFGNGSSIPNISPTAFMVDACMNIYTSGWGRCLNFGTPLAGNNNNMPYTSNAIDSTTDGCDFYFFVLRANAQSLWYATYFGATGLQEHVDGGTSRFDPKGVIYQSVCAGCWNSSAFPTTPGAWSNTNNGGSGACNNAIVKFAFELDHLAANANPSTSPSGCAPYTIIFANSSLSATNYIWNYDDGTPQDSVYAPFHEFLNPGTYDVQLIAIDSTGCFQPDTAHIAVTVVPNFSVDLGSDTLLCGTANIHLDAGVSGTGFTYTWSNGSITDTTTTSGTGDFWVNVSNGFCTHSDTISLTPVLPPALGSDTAICTGTTVTLNAGSPGASYIWSTGATSQTIAVTDSGTYTVVLSYQTCIFSDTMKLSLSPTPIVKLGSDTLLCGAATLLLDAGNSGATYNWTDGSSNKTLLITQSGTYGVQVSYGACGASDAISVQVIAYPSLEFPADTLLCHTDSITLDAGNPGVTYQWSTGASTQTILVTSPGPYSVSLNRGGCIITASTHVSNLLAPHLGSDTVFCGTASLALNAESPGANYKWSTGETTAAITATTAGIVWVEVSKGTCVKTDSVKIDVMKDGSDSLFIPNILTPNADGLNDDFQISSDYVNSFELKVYNRWGKIVYESDKLSDQWNGKYKSGDEAPTGVYFWIMKFVPACPNSQEVREKRGFVSLSR